MATYWGIYHPKDDAWLLDRNSKVIYYPAKEIAEAHCEHCNGYVVKKFI